MRVPRRSRDVAKAGGCGGFTLIELLTVMVLIVAVGGISGAVFNPAVLLGISVAKLTAWANLWIFLVAQVVGGVAAGLAFRAINADDE